MRWSALLLLVLAVRVARGQAPTTWLARGVPTPQAQAAILVLRDVASRGLRPSDYDAAPLAQAGRALAATPGATTSPGSDSTRIGFDRDLARAVARLLQHLHEGRVDPGALGHRLPDTHRTLDYVAMARAVSTASDVAAAVAAAEPPYAGYAALRGVLARYRALAADTTLRAPPPPPATLRPGGTYAEAAVLRRWLVALGDLPDVRPPVDATLYDDALADGVRAFQRRHGLEGDGVLGPATVGALRVPLARRVRQIELTLERWRWLPDVAPPRYVVVNVPAFRLYAFENDPAAARPLLRMDVIVGEAQRPRHTPVFTATMGDVVFHPYWDVPESIARNELIPRLRRDPGHAAREGFGIVRPDGSGAYGMTGANLSRVAAGTLRLRQRPGERNALGPVKFVFPNAYDVYLHGTPARQLFERTRRDFSHGCIRVADPAALASFVLRDQDGWDRAAVDAALRGSRLERVRIGRPLGVFILYGTVVPGDDGVVRFYPDLYGHDAALARRLEMPPAAER